MDSSIENAITLLNKIEEKSKTIDDDKSTEMAIFDR
jgi:hypothetical protein